MSKEIKMKPAFIVGDSQSSKIMKNYIKNSLCIENEWFSYCGRDVITVPEDKYIQVLKEGRVFAKENKLSCISWLDTDRIITSIEETTIGYGMLPENFVDAKGCKASLLLYIPEFQPDELRKYILMLQRYLKSEVAIKYHEGENALQIFTINFDYEQQMTKFLEFVEIFGNGPFTKIYPLTYDGAIKKNEKGEKAPMLAKKSRKVD